MQAGWYRGGARRARRPRGEVSRIQEPRVVPQGSGSPARLRRSRAVARTSPRSSGRCSRSGRTTTPSRPRSTSARARRSGSSTTARRSPTACRTTATCSPATPRTSSRASRPCAASRCTAASAGTPTACPPSSRPSASSASPTRARSRRWASPRSTRAARDSVLRYTEEWQDYVTRQARWVDFENDYKTLDITFMESVIWAFKQLHDKGLAYEGYRVLPYCWRDETPLSNHELRMDDDVYKDAPGPDRHRHLPARRREGRGARPHRRARPRLDDDAVDPADQPRARRRPRHQYAVVPAGPNGTPDATVLRERAGGTDGTEVLGAEYLIAIDLVGNYAKDLGYESAADAHGRRLPHRRSAASSRASRYDRLWDYYADAETWGTQNALAHPRRRLRHHRGRHRHRAPGARLRRGGPEGLRGRRHPRDHLRRRRRQVPLRRDRGRRPARSSTRTSRSRSCCKAEGRLLRQASYEHSLPALLALPQPADLQGRLELVRARHRVPRPHGRAQPGDQLGSRERQGRPVRQVGRATPATGRSAATATGARPIPVWKSDDPEYPRIDVYGSLDELERDFGRLPRNAAGEPDLHRPYIDELTRPNPDDPTGAVDDAPHRRRARRLVRLRLDAVRPGALPVREPGLVRQRTTPPTSSSSTSGRRAAGSTCCTCSRPRCSTGRRSRTSSATASCSAATARRCRSRCATTPTSPRSSTATAPMRCAGS